ncbi:MAG TPA: diguanylate cyclase [Acetobacteraceae bacterium]|nr:diguanylate cyclase [Acetobacteraceae bacterium]
MSQRPQQTILVVDDTAANLGVMAELLEAQGFRVIVAQDGSEAMQRAQRMHPDLILMDVMMPGIDGFQVCRELKAAEDTHAIPVIFMSALRDQRSKVEGFEAGAVDYITKPIETAEVLMRVRTHLHLRAMQLRLEALSISDALTGLANRRRFDEVLRTEWLRALRSHRSVAMVMIDIDVFKSYNDHYGHIGGDRCLSAVAGALQTAIRQDLDLAARYGGEEFALVLPDCDAAGAAEVASRAHQAVLELREPHPGSQSGYVTISAGAAAMVPVSEAGAAQLIEAADQALYAAKQQGRNQTIVAGSRRSIPTGAGAAPATQSAAGFRRPDRFQAALLDSRQRWQDLATMAADFSFETDSRGCFTFINPDPALGWPAFTLVGQPSDLLLRTERFADDFNPFRIASPVCRRGVWLKRADGSIGLFLLTVRPLRDATGDVVGARGTAIEYFEHAGYPARIASEIRRVQLLDYILQQCQETGWESMPASIVTSLVTATGALGAMLVDVAGDTAEPDVLFQVGDPPAWTLHSMATLMSVERGMDEAGGPAEQPLLFTECGRAESGNVIALALWREAGRADWHQDDSWLIRIVGSIIGAAVAGPTRRRGSARSSLKGDRSCDTVSRPNRLVPAPVP